MDRYKKKILEKEILGLEEIYEKQKIMNSINSTKKNNGLDINKIIVSTITIAVVTFILLSPFNTSNNEPGNNGPIILDKSIFSVIKVSANEYVINDYGEDLLFEVHTLIENPNRVKLSKEFSYYKTMRKYIDVSDKVSVTPYEFRSIKILHVNIDNRIDKYLHIVENEYTKYLSTLDYDFEDFYQELEILSELVEMYPPIETLEIGEYITRPIYEVDENYINEIENKYPDKVKLYTWFIDKMNEGSYSSYDPNEITSVYMTFYMDGDSKKNIGEINNVTGGVVYGGKAPNKEYIESYQESPLLINKCKTNSFSKAMNSDDEVVKQYIYLHEPYEECNEPYNNRGYTSAVFNLSKIEFKSLKDLDIEIKVNGEIITDDKYFLKDKVLYMYPIPIEKEYDTEFNDYFINADVDIIIKQNDEVIYRKATGRSSQFRLWKNYYKQK